MEMQILTDSISYFPATESPLSADVGIIRCDDVTWIFDVGSSEEAAAAINGISGKKNVVLSHFHADHSDNIGCVEYGALYAGKYTCSKFDAGMAVEDHMYFENGIHLFPLSSSHSKGCVGLEYEDYAFLGDAVYSMKKDGKIAYNAGLLKEMITTLKSINAKWFLLSHSEPFAQPKAEVIAQMEEIYACRINNEPYIFLQ